MPRHASAAKGVDMVIFTMIWSVLAGVVQLVGINMIFGCIPEQVVPYNKFILTVMKQGKLRTNQGQPHFGKCMPDTKCERRFMKNETPQ